jgi:N-acetylglucosaminyldiphosphoundecaprenol N-acetyl-beta-D-mannosaminyltransferase
MPLSKPNPIPRSSPTQAPVTDPSTVELLGIELALTDYERVMDWIDAMVERDKHGYVIPAAVHCMMVAHEEPETWDAVQGGLVVPDGQPLVWAMRMLGHPTASRVYGPELMARYCERAASTGTRMFLYGGRNQGALVQLALNLRRRYPGVKIVGGYSPPFRELDGEETAAIADEINGSGADVVWVGIGQPKQEKWMAGMRARLDAPVLIGVGAAFDFHAGLVPQAPSWMQELGLEWAYRLAHEPRRLWRRYARYNPRFVAAFARQWARDRMRRSA